LLCFFRFASFIRFASIFSLHFLFVLHMKSSFSLQSETNPCVSFRSKKNIASVLLSFASNRKRTAHPIVHIQGRQQPSRRHTVHTQSSGPHSCSPQPSNSQSIIPVPGIPKSCYTQCSGSYNTQSCNPHSEQSAGKHLHYLRRGLS
jgi:hypothetical protein